MTRVSRQPRVTMFRLPVSRRLIHARVSLSLFYFGTGQTLSAGFTSAVIEADKIRDVVEVEGFETLRIAAGVPASFHSERGCQRLSSAANDRREMLQLETKPPWIAPWQIFGRIAANKRSIAKIAK
ncbi:hypothetical protein HN011_006900 [Eciton burchellii]|nr:hypothetical protein HN011_006900 [Eciton burchellii]